MSSGVKQNERPPIGVKPKLPPSGERSISVTSLKSDSSRDGLRRDVNRLKRSLTPNEKSFLEFLMRNGHDSEIDVARQKLNDTSVFFPSDSSISEETKDDSGENEGIYDLTDCKERNLSDNSIEVSSSLSGNELTKNPRQIRRQSSVKLKQHMENRLNSNVYQKIWRAHETGLSVTPVGSYKSVVNRASFRRSRSAGVISPNRGPISPNASFLSTATQELLTNGGPVSRPGEDQVFRQSDSLHTDVEKKEDTNENLPPLESLSVPHPCRRILSDASRKSVTFDDHAVSPRGFLPFRPKYARRQMSTDSLGGESSNTVESFPALKHAYPIRSDSVCSIPSLHRARAIRSDSIVEMMSGEGRAPAWSSPLAKTDIELKYVSPREGCKISKPILFRKASRNTYQGEGIEISYLNEENVSVNKAREYSSMAFPSDCSIRSTLSWDEGSTRETRVEDHPIIPQSLSDEEISSYFLGKSKALPRLDSRTSLRSIADVNISDEEDDDDESWDMNSTSEHPNAWNVLKDPYSIGYGAEGTLPFRILGTSADDESAQPHVLSPPLMESLYQFLPFEISEQNFLMKYSLVRDGASLLTLLQNVRGAKHTILAIETSDGDVFGSFTSEPWRKSWNYFGTGESFLWRMRQSRKVVCHSIIDQAQMESELDVYPWIGENNCVQLCTHDKIAIGGGIMSQEKKEDHNSTSQPVYGFGLAVDRDLHYGTSSHCATFGSPPLSKSSQNDPFEIVNVEVWSLTPCSNLEDAEKLELGRLFLTTQSQ